jgi:hypothetical protein
MSLHRLVILVVVSATALHAQPVRDVPSREIGLSGGTTHGIGAGAGRELQLDLRWSPRSAPWFAMRAELGSSSLRGAAFMTDSRNLLPGPVAQIGDFLADATTMYALAGPEVSVRLGPVRPYLFTVGGIARVTSSGRNFGTRPSASDTFPVPLYARDLSTPINVLRNVGALMSVGGGVRVPVAPRLRLDFGVHRSYSTRFPWYEDALYTLQGGALGMTRTRSYTYARRIDAWAFRIGASYAP